MEGPLLQAAIKTLFCSQSQISAFHELLICPEKGPQLSTLFRSKDAATDHDLPPPGAALKGLLCKVAQSRGCAVVPIEGVARSKPLVRKMLEILGLSLPF